MPMMHPVRTKRLFALPLLLVFLASCAERSSPPPDDAPVIEPHAVLNEALANAYKVDTMHQEFRMSFSGGGERFALSGTADVDNTRQRASMSMDLGMLGGTMDMVVADGVAYMRSPMTEGQVDTEWVSMDLATIDPAAAAQFSGGFGDASSYVALFAGVVDARAVGEEIVRGIRTTHFTGTIDVLKASEAVAEVVGEEAGSDAQRHLERSILQLKLLGLRDIPFDAWVDGDGLLRRERFTMDLGLVPGAEGASMEMTIDLSRYGEPVDIRVPSRSEVTDITRLVKSGGG
jgi:hypothetical protein